MNKIKIEQAIEAHEATLKDLKRQLTQSNELSNEATWAIQSVCGGVDIIVNDCLTKKEGRMNFNDCAESLATNIKVISRLKTVIQELIADGCFFDDALNMSIIVNEDPIKNLGYCLENIRVTIALDWMDNV
tara:strand:- start:3082 stop:3474 length:393 start_codon:yes stop_codon:yes gene_type:complete